MIISNLNDDYCRVEVSPEWQQMMAAIEKDIELDNQKKEGISAPSSWQGSSLPEHATAKGENTAIKQVLLNMPSTSVAAISLDERMVQTENIHAGMDTSLL